MTTGLVVVDVADPVPVAAGDDGSLDLAFGGPSEILLGETATYSLAATNNGGGGDLYNLSWQLILPAGAAVTASDLGEPTIEVADSPAAGQTTLVWTNIEDLQVNVTKSHEVTVSYAHPTWDVAGIPSITAGAFASGDARQVPDFNADGSHNDTSDTTAFDTQSNATEITAVRITKDEPNAESELLRGVHDEFTTYTLTIQNNFLNVTDTIVVEDWLPAGVEFLGCRSVDNTSASPVTNTGGVTFDEYVGSGSLIDAPVSALPAPCFEPDFVETRTLTADEVAPGSAPGVYTYVRWDVDAGAGIDPGDDGSLTAGETFDIQYSAGIPLRQNEMFTVDPGTAGEQIANLDNNTGALTADEQQWTNWARVEGFYRGPNAGPSSDTDSEIVIAEDLSIHKSVDDGVFVQREEPRWTLFIETGEYRDAEDLVVVDTVPDGLCPIVTGGCAGTAAAPTVGGVTDQPDIVTENTDGSWTLTWNTIPDLTPSDDLTIEFSTVVRGAYQEGFADDTPVVGGDYWTNTVDITGATDPIPDAPDRAGEPDTIDASSAGQVSETVDIVKSISAPAAAGDPLSCDTASWIVSGDAPVGFKPGDRVCYRLQVDFTLDLDFRNPQVTDFIPPNTSFEAFWGVDPGTTDAASGVTVGNQAPIGDVELVDFGPGGVGDGSIDAIVWSLGSDITEDDGTANAGDLYIDETSDLFEVVFSVIVAGDPRDASEFDIIENLAKLTHQNSAHLGGETYSSRDLAGFPFVEPHLVLDKRNAPDGDTPDDDPESGVQGSVFDYSVTISNDVATTGSATQDAHAAALDINVLDTLPPLIECSDVSAIAVAGPDGAIAAVCNTIGTPTDSDTISSTIPRLDPGETATLTYTITVPTDIAAGATLTNTAEVLDFDQQTDNRGGSLEYDPGDNIGPLEDTAVVDIVDVTVVKGQTSSDDDTDVGGSDGGDQNRSGDDSQDQGTQDATIGETITYRFDVTVPEGVDMYNATITDDLDAEISFVSLDAGAFQLTDAGGFTALTITNPATGAGYFDIVDNDTLDAGDIAVTLVGDVLTATFPATWENPVGADDDLFWIEFTAVVDNDASVDAGDNIDNYADVDWQDVTGTLNFNSESNRARTRVVEPNISIAKTDDGTDTDSPADGDSNVVAGQTIEYTVTVSNGSGGNDSDAFDLVITDVLPLGVTFVAFDGANAADSQAFVADGTTTEGTITWTLDQLDVGDSMDLVYTVTVDTDSVAATQLTNAADVTATSRATDTPADERTAANDPNTSSRYDDDVDNTIELPLALIDKDIAPFGGVPDVDVSDYPVGDAMDFELYITIPNGSRTYDTTVFDTLPAFLEFDSYGTPTISGTECEQAGTATDLVAVDVIRLTPDGQTLGWYIGDVEGQDANCVITLPYSAHVDIAADTDDSGDNSATVQWHDSEDITVDPDEVTDLSGETWNESDGPASETVNVIEPDLSIDKDVQLLDPGVVECEPSDDADECDTIVTAEHRFTVTVTNDGDGPAHDITTVDTLPTIGTGMPDTFTGPDTPVYSLGDRTLTWTHVGPIAPGGSITYTYDVTVTPSSVLTNDDELVNTADATEYFGMSSADRTAAPDAADVPTYGGARNPVTADSVTLTVEFPDLVIEKNPGPGSDATDARAGEAFTWDLVVTNDGGATAFDIDVDDVLPSAWLFDTGSAQIDTGSGFGALADPTGGTTGPLLWTDVVASLDAGDSFTIRFDTIPQASLLTTGTTGTFDHENDSGVDGEDASGETSNATGGYGDDNDATDPANGGGDPYDSDNSVARIRRIDLEIDKSIVETAPYYFGDFVTYRIVVTNDDTVIAVDPASEVTVKDVLPSGVVYDSFTASEGTYVPGTDTWTLTSSLMPGESETLDIVVQINTDAAITNHTEVETAGQWDIDSTPGNWDDGVGTDEDDNDTVTFTPEVADLGNRIWFDVDNDGEQDPGEPGIAGVDVTVSWTDPGTLLTVERTTTTNADGEYAFDDLPQDIDLTVTVDAADLPAGLTQTFELVDDPDITDTQASNAQGGAVDGIVTEIQLTGTNPSYLDVDFGYTGTGSLGDYVWYDQNRDGVQDAAEQAIPSIDITVEYAGPDGVYGDDPGTIGVDESADDVAYSDTTDADGLYLVENLPAGSYRVIVDTADLPDFIDQATWDADFGVSDDAADLDDETTHVLAAGEDQRGLDFGYAGPGRLGDTVWLDLDEDGVLDDGEVGLGGIEVTATFTGPTGDPVVLTTTTATDGTYLFGGLPLGVAITVTVDDTDLPTSTTQTHDLDDPADGSSTAATAHEATVTLTVLAPERLDVDFGYVGDHALGDTIWLDMDGSGEATPQAGDVLLPSVEVTATWTNPGGTDLVLTATTAADGTYRFDGLPDGDYTVAVNPATLPGGVTPVVDPDGGADNGSATTIAGADDLDQDFSYTGTGSIGDLVWNDLDDDGVQDTDEDGIPDVDVTIVWTDPITGATTTIETTTDADGGYLVENLPAGDYTVSIDPETLPDGMAPTYDLDGGDDRTSDLVLDPGEDQLDVDFGERLELDLSIEKTSSGEWSIGSEEQWTLTVRNLGPATTDGRAVVTDELPDGVSYVRAESTGFACAEANSRISCVAIGAMAAGDSAIIVITVLVEAAAADTGSIVNTAVVEHDGEIPDVEPENDTDDDEVAVPLSILGIQKTLVDDSLVTGQAATWRITVTNYGPSPSNDTIRVVDELPTTLAYVSSTSDDFTCSAEGQVVTCTSDTVVAVDESITLDLTTTVTAAAGVTVTNSAGVFGGTVVGETPLPEDVLDDARDDLDVSVPTVVDGNAETPPSPTLAFTGIDIEPLISLAIALVAMGWALTVFGRRRDPATVTTD
ncbi:MAG: SdrD B-like domain-containing protein [Actinomycetota bacterium]